MNKQSFFKDAGRSVFLRRAAWLFGLPAMAIFIFCLVAGFQLTRAQTDDENKPAADSALTAARDDDDDEVDECNRRSGPIVQLPTTKLFIEYNATNEDTGIHGDFVGLGWKKLCIYDPRGRLILEFKPQNQLKRLLGMDGVRFESREPPIAEVPVATILAQFPEGRYSVRGLTFDGRRIRGGATFTHAIPEAPEITYPADEATIPRLNQVFTWLPVTQTIFGGPLQTTAYQVIITKDVPDDPNGFSRPTLDIIVPATQTSLSIPGDFLQPNTRYELEVLALEVSGNQTISIIHFRTQ